MDTIIEQGIVYAWKLKNHISHGNWCSRVYIIPFLNKYINRYLFVWRKKYNIECTASKFPELTKNRNKTIFEELSVTTGSHSNSKKAS